MIQFYLIGGVSQNVLYMKPLFVLLVARSISELKISKVHLLFVVSEIFDDGSRFFLENAEFTLGGHKSEPLGSVVREKVGAISVSSKMASQILSISRADDYHRTLKKKTRSFFEKKKPSFFLRL